VFGCGEKMPTINSTVAVLFQFSDCLMFVMGCGILWVGIYALPGSGAAPYSVLNEEWFRSFGIGCLFIFFHIMLSMFVTCFGLTYQMRDRPMKTWWTGRRILILRTCMLLGLTITAGFVMVEMYNLSLSFNNTVHDINSGSSPNYDYFEIKFSKAFNNDYYEAQLNCGAEDWIWGLVDKNCGYASTSTSVTMLEAQCSTSCSSTSGTCIVKSQADCNTNRYFCPFNSCRKGLLEWMLGYVNNIYYMAVFFFILALFQLVLGLGLSCYHHKASFLNILAKTGAVKFSHVKKRNPKEEILIFRTKSCQAHHDKMDIMQKKIKNEDETGIVFLTKHDSEV
jgi:hypothetical protein